MPFLSLNPFRSYRLMYGFFHTIIKPNLLKRSQNGIIRNTQFIPSSVYLIQNPQSRYKSETVTDKDDQVTITVDVKTFKEEELNVVLSGNVIIVEGLHEEKIDEKKSAYTYFMKQYLLSDEHDLENIKPFLKKDGTLTIVAPKKPGRSVKNEDTTTTMQTIKLGPPKTLKIQKE